MVYNQTIQAVGGIPPYTVQLTTGALPGGLTLSTAGLLSGTPTSCGTFAFTVTITDSSAGPSSVDLDYALTIGKATLTISAGNKTKVSGQANPPLTATFTGLVNGDMEAVVSGLMLDTTATMASGVGTYPITATGGTATNYFITHVNGTLTVTPAPPTVTAPSALITVNAATFPIQGVTEANLLIRVYKDNNDDGLINGADAVVASQQLIGGATMFTIAAPLTQGTAGSFVNHFLVVAVDALGNESVPTDVPDLTEDSTPPAPPTVTSPAAPARVDATTFAIQGVAEADVLIRVYRDNDNNGMINGADAVVAFQQLAGGAMAYSINAPLLQGTVTDIVNSFLVATVDALGNQSAPINVPDITEDSTVPTVTINQAADQGGHAFSGPIKFTVVFSEPVTGFAAADVVLGGTALGALVQSVVETGPMNGTTYTVEVDGMTRAGTVTAMVPAGAASAGPHDNLASTSTDNTVLFGALTATGSDTGPGTVKVYDAVSGQEIVSFAAYDVIGYNGGTRVALADVTGDAIPDLVTAPGAGLATGARVQVYDGSALLAGTLPIVPLVSFLPYTTPTLYTGEVHIAAGDFNGDNKADIVTGNVPPKGPTVKLFDGANLAGNPLASFKPFGGTYQGGARVAVGNVNADDILNNGNDRPDLIVGQSKNGSLIKAYDGDQLLAGKFKVLLQKAVFPTVVKGGVFLAAGNIDGDARIDILVGLGSGAKSFVYAFEDASNGNTAAKLLKKSAVQYGASKAGVRVAAVDLTGDGLAEVLTTAGTGLSPYRLRVLNSLTLTAINTFFEQAPDFADGRFVAAARLG